MENELVNVSQSSIAQALATDYFCIYYVNVNDNRFIEYSASPEYRQLGLPTMGDDFITFARTNFEEIIHPDDQEGFLDCFVKEDIIEALDELTVVVKVRNSVRVAPEPEQLVVGPLVLDIAQIQLDTMLVGIARRNGACRAWRPIVHDRFIHDSFLLLLQRAARFSGSPPGFLRLPRLQLQEQPLDDGLLDLELEVIVVMDLVAVPTEELRDDVMPGVG